MTALDVVTLVVAIVGACTGIASLAWQAGSFVLSGPRVKVELVLAWLGPGGALVGKAGMWDPGQAPSSAFSTECWGIKVRNVGRLPTSVTRCSVRVGAAEALPAPMGPQGYNQALPHRLDTGEEATWFIERSFVDQYALALVDRTGDIRATATLGSGKAATSRESAPLPQHQG